MSKKLVRELHIDANASLGGGKGSSSLKRKRRSVKMDDDGGGGGERKGGGEQQEEEEEMSEAKEEGGKEASSLPLTPPSSHNTTSPRPTADPSHSPLEVLERAVDDAGEPHVAPSVEPKKEGNEILDGIARSSEASKIRVEEVNDPPSHKQGLKITDFFRKTPKTTHKASTSSTTTTKAQTAASTTTIMSTKRANLPPDKDKPVVKLANATSHTEEDGSKTDSVSSDEVHSAPAVKITDKGAKTQSRKDSVSSSSAPAAPQMNTAPLHAKIAASTSTPRTITSPSLRDKSYVSATQQTADMALAPTPAPTTQATKTRRASGVSATSSVTSSHGTDNDHDHHTSEFASDTEHDNQKSNPAPTTRTRRASRLSNRFINTVDAKPVTHIARRKSNAEDDSSESDESDVDDQGTGRKRTPGIVCADTMIKNWKRYGYGSAKDARIQIGRILAKDESKHSTQDRDALEPQEADGMEQPRIRRQAKKGTVRIETMIKNWGRYHFASAAEARAASAGLSQDTELGVDEIAARLRKHRANSHSEQVDDTQPDDTQPENLSEDEWEAPSLDTSTLKVDSVTPGTTAETLTLEPKTVQQESPSHPHDDITNTVKDPKAARVLKQLQMDVSPGIFGSPGDTTTRRSRERKRKNRGDDADADAEVLPITPSSAAMAPPSAKRVKIASPLTLGDASTQVATPKPAHPLTSDPATIENTTPTLAQPATPDAKPPVDKTTTPRVAVPSFTPINQHDKKTAKQKELDRLRMDVAPGIFASKSASPRSTRGERKRDALVDLDLPIAPATNPSNNVKKSDQDQDNKKKNKEKDVQEQTKSRKRTNSDSLALPDTSLRAMAPPSKKLKLTFGPRKFPASSSTRTASTNTSSIAATPSQQQTERRVSALPTDIVGNGPIPRFIRAESFTPSVVAVDREHAEKGWMVINPVYVNSLYDYLNHLVTENDEDEEYDEGVQSKDGQGEEFDEEENARKSDSLTTEQEKAKQTNEKEWEKDEADVADINKRMLREVEMIMTWSVMTDAEKRDAGIAG